MRKKVVILGAGESGTGSAILAANKGYDVFVSDLNFIKEKYKKVLCNYKIAYEEGKHSLEKILIADFVIKSPGIPESASVIKSILKQNIHIVSEIEFAGQFTSAKKICITGSNGKTTTTLLIYHMLKKAGINAGLAGNVGKSFAWQVAEEKFDHYVIELSSFQLDGMCDFKAEVALLLNITPDHLDRYGFDMQRYIDSKFRIIQNQGKNDFFIYNSDDINIHNELEKREINAVQLPFTLKKQSENGAWLTKRNINIKYNKKQFSMSILDLSLQGKHNTYNSMAAGIAGMVLDIRDQRIRESLSDFKGVEHRLERFLVVHGIEFINDSKATNVNSAWYALESMNKPVVWIAGGIDKGNDYSMIKDLVKKKVKAIVCLGKNNTKIHAAFGRIVKDIIDVHSMPEAVKTAYYLARNGETVLLSPACASFDLFESYEDRGKQFKQSVREL